MFFHCLIDSFNKSVRKKLKGHLNYRSKENVKGREEGGEISYR